MTDKENLSVTEVTAKKKQKTKRQVWTIVGIVVLVLVFAGAGTSGYFIHQSNTNPEFCATCHIMQRNVTSYLTSNDLDNVHEQANVECKECHNYPLSSEISSGIKFVLGDYTVDKNGDLQAVTYDNEICLKCHISYEHVSLSTDFLYRNPHNSHNGELDCKTCHVSHGDQIDYCSTCHDNGGQRLIGDDTKRDETIQ